LIDVVLLFAGRGKKPYRFIASGLREWYKVSIQLYNVVAPLGIKNNGNVNDISRREFKAYRRLRRTHAE